MTHIEKITPIYIYEVNYVKLASPQTWKYGNMRSMALDFVPDDVFFKLKCKVHGINPIEIEKVIKPTNIKDNDRYEAIVKSFKTMRKFTKNPNTITKYVDLENNDQILIAAYYNGNFIKIALVNTAIQIRGKYTRETFDDLVNLLAKKCDINIVPDSTTYDLKINIELSQSFDIKTAAEKLNLSLKSPFNGVKTPVGLLIFPDFDKNCVLHVNILYKSKPLDELVTSLCDYLKSTFNILNSSTTTDIDESVLVLENTKTTDITVDI